MDYETILTEDKDGVATVTFNRPERMNAYNARMGREVRHAIVGFDRREDIRAIVVTGAGRAFCAGAIWRRGARRSAVVTVPDVRTGRRTSCASMTAGRTGR